MPWDASYRSPARAALATSLLALSAALAPAAPADAHSSTDAWHRLYRADFAAATSLPRNCQPYRSGGSAHAAFARSQVRVVPSALHLGIAPAHAAGRHYAAGAIACRVPSEGRFVLHARLSMGTAGTIALRSSGRRPSVTGVVVVGGGHVTVVDRGYVRTLTQRYGTGTHTFQISWNRHNVEMDIDGKLIVKHSPLTVGKRLIRVAASSTRASAGRVSVTKLSAFSYRPVKHMTKPRSSASANPAGGLLAPGPKLFIAAAIAVALITALLTLVLRRLTPAEEGGGERLRSRPSSHPYEDFPDDDFRG